MPKIILMLILCSISLSASEKDILDLEQKARALFHIEKYEDSAQTYREILKQSTSEDQKAITHINEATALYYENQYEKALETLEKISLEKISLHIAIRALLNRSNIIIKYAQCPTSTSEINIELVQKALKLLKKAGKYDTLMAKQLEADNTPLTAEIKSLESEAKIILAILLYQQEEFYLETIPYQEAISKLSNKLTTLNKEILQKVNLNSAEDMLYGTLALQLFEVDPWKKWWEATKSSLENGSRKSVNNEDLIKLKNIHSNFQEAHNKYLKSSDYLAEKSLWKAILELRKSEIILQNLALDNKDPIKTLLIQRLKTKRMILLTENSKAQKILKKEDAYTLQSTIENITLLISTLDQDPEQEQRVFLLHKLLVHLNNSDFKNDTDYLYDIILYRQIEQDEGDTLVELYYQSKKGQTDKSFSMTLEILKDKLQFGNHAHAEKTLEELEQGASLKQIEKALISWDPIKFIELAVKELIELYSDYKNHPFEIDRKTNLLSKTAYGSFYPESFIKKRVALINSIEDSQKNLRYGKGLLNKNKKEADIFFRGNIIILQQALLNLQEQQPPKPSEILEQAIKAQESVHNLSLLGLSLSRQKPLEPYTHNLFTKLQNFPLLKIESFPVEPSPEISEKAIELVKNSQEEALQAQVNLKLSNLNPAIDQQEKALILLKKALEELKQETDDNSDNEEDNKENSEENTEKNNDKPASNLPPGMTELLQQMYEEDRIETSKKTENKNIRQGLRPW